MTGAHDCALPADAARHRGPIITAMSRPKERRNGGRTTPKKGSVQPSDPSGRYTPPIPKEQKVSPPWVAAVMFTLLGLGMLIIIVNYFDVLPGGASNWYLLLGLGLITGGFITATQLH